MCRLTAYCGARMALHPLVFGGDHALHRQSWEPRELLSGAVNADGYGVAWYDAPRWVRVAQCVPIWHDEDLEGLLHGVSADVALAALRNATPGHPVDRAGLLPMIHDGHAFILNGFVADFPTRWIRAFRESLPDHLYGALRGSSDSETLFMMALARIESGASRGEALADLSAFVRSTVGGAGMEAQLTMALADSEGVTLVRTGTANRTNSLYLTTRSSLFPEGNLVASEPLNGEEGWEAIPTHHRLEMNKAGFSEVTPL